MNLMMEDELFSDTIDPKARKGRTRQANALGCDHLTKQELKRIRSDIASTNRPSWQRAPPTNLGEAEHGKLKADQWRSCMEFDIPASLVQMWARENTNADDRKACRRQKLLESTMLLAKAVRWGTSHITSQKHVDQYMEYMEAYLQSLADLYPQMHFRPNHHAALHVGVFLLRFGPMHGWWMFPFERIIGNLQKIKTNHKLGWWPRLLTI